MKKISIILFSIVLLAAVLRLYHLSSNPTSLYWDEASLGYNAYSISQSLHDEHNEFLPTARFIAFGDYKAPVYIYSDVPFVKLFGPTEFAIRLPSAIAGILMVISSYFLCQEIFASSRKRKSIGLIASLIFALSPWSLQLSRAAFEANLATAIMSFGILFLLKFFRKLKVINLILSAVLLALTMYAFNSHRVFIPLFVAIVGLLNFRTIVTSRNKVALGLIVFVIFLIPIIPYFLSRESRLRFNEVAWINDISPIVLSNSRVVQDGGGILPKIIHNRRLVYFQEFLIHYTDNFKANFLFFSGDPNPKLSIQKVGELYWFDLIPFIFGLILLLKKHNKSAAIVFSWYLLGVIPASTARETPHALRISPVLPIPQVIIAFGLVQIFQFIEKYKNWMNKTFIVITSSLLVITLLIYSQYYWKWYPQNVFIEWQYGYKQMVSEVMSELPNYSGATVTEIYGRPYIYFLLYGGPISPQSYFETGKSDRDWFGLWTVHSIGNIYFGDTDQIKSNWLYIRPPGQTPKGAVLINKILDPKGNTVFEISHT